MHEAYATEQDVNDYQRHALRLPVLYCVVNLHCACLQHAHAPPS